MIGRAPQGQFEGQAASSKNVYLFFNLTAIRHLGERGEVFFKEALKHVNGKTSREYRCHKRRANRFYVGVIQEDWVFAGNPIKVKLFSPD